MIPVVILAIEDNDDREFMIRLYQDHRLLLYSVIYPIVRNADDTEDLIQDVVVKLIDILGFLRGFDRSALASYLAEMGRNCALNHVSRAARRKNVSSINTDQWEDRGSEVNEILLEKLRVEDLRSVWPTLREETRRILTMKYFLSMPDEEIAREFGIRPGSVRMRLSRARREAKDAMEKLS